MSAAAGALDNPIEPIVLAMAHGVAVFANLRAGAKAQQPDIKVQPPSVFEQQQLVVTRLLPSANPPQPASLTQAVQLKLLSLLALAGNARSIRAPRKCSGAERKECAGTHWVRGHWNLDRGHR